MEEQTVRQLQGAADLLQDAVTHGAGAIERAHLQTMRVPYAVLERVRPIAGPVRVVERVQVELTVVVYGAVRGIAGLAAAATRKAIQLCTEQYQGQGVRDKDAIVGDE